jgi:hypothetical protein
MEDLAKDQLSTLQSINAAIRGTADKTGLAAAGSKTATGLQKAARAGVGSIAKIVSPKELDSKNLRKSIDSGVDKNLDIFKQYSDGTISQVEAGEKLKENFTSLSSYIDTTFRTSLNNATEEIDKFKNQFPLIGQIDKLISGKLPEVKGRQASNTNTNNIETVRNTSSSPTNNTQTQSTNAPTDKPIEITLNHNIDLKTNGNIDTNQVVLALKNTDVQQGMVSALKEAMYSNGLLAPTSNKAQLMNPNVSQSYVG